MGLASKLAAAGGGAATYGAPAGGAPPYPPAGGAPPYPPAGGAPPYPPAGGAPPYPQGPPPGAGGAPSPYPPQGPPPGQGGAPSPYPPGAFSQPYPAGPGVPGGQGAPSAPPAPYPGGPPPAAGAAPYPGGPSGAPSPYPPQQQQGGPPGREMPYPGTTMPPGGGPPGAGGYPPYPGAPPGSMPPRPGGPPAAGGPYGGPSGPTGAPGGMVGAIQAKLTAIINANQLQRFYPPQNIPALAARVDQRVNFTDLAARWRMPKELAVDLACLALYDIVMFVDDSGSMAFEENGERIEDLKLIASKVAEVATMFDDDGILMRFMNSPIDGSGLRSQADVSNLLARVQYSGLTPLAASLQSRVLQPIVYSLAGSGQLAKPVLIMTITDGEPTDNPKDMVVQVIKDARARTAATYGPKAVAFEFAQVGKDQKAQAFLSRLDNDPEVGSSIDCTSYYEMEQSEYAKKGVQLSPEAWLVKMMVGAVDSSYDEQDEG